MVFDFYKYNVIDKGEFIIGYYDDVLELYKDYSKWLVQRIVEDEEDVRDILNLVLDLISHLRPKHQIIYGKEDLLKIPFDMDYKYISVLK